MTDSEDRRDALPRGISRVEELYHAARARPLDERDAFLAEACRGDEALLSEVRSLLGYGEAARRLLEEPADAATTERVFVTPGARLGPYEVRELIGAGGMGEVYRARDTRLGRDVAVKVLPAHVADDPDALARFARETRIVASLNHAHICALYDVGRELGVEYLVMELLEGETLRQRLERGPLHRGKALALAAQLCRALSAAHARGIVHRDLKPDNVFLTRDGVKVLDFGLARHTAAPEGDAATAPQTVSGQLRGTVGYLSPEQARGEPADARSDIFALGVVLYEMLTGRRPFARSTAAETLAAVLNEEPPVLKTAAGAASPGLERVVRRCLEKDPADRFGSAHDVELALEAVSGDPLPPRPRVTRRRRAVWTAALVTALALAGLWRPWAREAPRPPLRVRPITSERGQEMDPALSPDGHQLAYVKLTEGPSGDPAGSRGRQDLYVKLIDGGVPVLVSRGTASAIGPAWSPDGQQLAFLRPVEDVPGEIATGVFVVPALGGAERRLAVSRGRSWVGLDWSPDGRLLALADSDSPEEPGGIFLLSYETGERRRLTRPPAGFQGDTWPRFSPDGGTLAYVRVRAVFDTDLYLVPIAGGEERRLTVGNLSTTGLDWTADGKSLVFSAWRPGGTDLVNLWRVDVSGGDPELLVFGETGYWPTIAQRGGRLAYVHRSDSQDIWRIGGPGTPDVERAGKRLVSSTRRDLHPRYSPDGRQIAFLSFRSGAGEIWICDADGASPRQLTFLDGPINMFPIWSPDGEQIAFSSMETGSLSFYVVGVSGGVPRRLSAGPLRAPLWSWSHDGRWLYFFSNETGHQEVWKLPAEGGEPIQVTRRGGTWAAESRDGRFLYFAKTSQATGLPGIWRIPTDGGEEHQVLDRGHGHYWAVLEEGIVYVDDSTMPHALASFDFATGEIRQIAELEVPVDGPGFDVSPDGRWILYTTSETSEADIVLVENFE